MKRDAQSQCEVNLRGFPDGLVKVISADLDKLQRLIPRWCVSLDIAFDDAPDDGGRSPACTMAEPEYRHAQIVICPVYFNCADTDRLYYLAHELIHIMEWGLSSQVETLIRMASPRGAKGKGFRKWARDLHRKESEGSAQDLAGAFIGMLADATRTSGKPRQKRKC